MLIDLPSVIAASQAQGIHHQTPLNVGEGSVQVQLKLGEHRLNGIEQNFNLPADFHTFFTHLFQQKQPKDDVTPQVTQRDHG